MLNKLFKWLLRLFGISVPLVVEYRTAEAPSDNEIVAWLNLKHWTWFMDRVKQRCTKEIGMAMDEKMRNEAALRLSGVLLAEEVRADIISEFQNNGIFDPESFGVDDETAVDNFEKKHGHIVFQD